MKCEKIIEIGKFVYLWKNLVFDNLWKMFEKTKRFWQDDENFDEMWKKTMKIGNYK